MDTARLLAVSLQECNCEEAAVNSLCVSLCLLNSTSYNIDNSSCRDVCCSSCDITCNNIENIIHIASNWIVAIYHHSDVYIFFE